MLLRIALHTQSYFCCTVLGKSPKTLSRLNLDWSVKEKYRLLNECPLVCLALVGLTNEEGLFARIEIHDQILSWYTHSTESDG